jgi:hypothetical protein
MKTDWLHQKFKMKIKDGPFTFIDIGNKKIEIKATKIPKGDKQNKEPKF